MRKKKKKKNKVKHNGFPVLMQRTAITNIILSAREVTGLWHMLHWEKQSKVKYISKIISLCMTNVDGMVWYGMVW